MTGTPVGGDTAVIIVNYRTKELTLEAARSVVAEPEVAEIVVVDNDSGDGSEEFLRSQLSQERRARVVASPTNVGFGRGLNLGVECSTAPLVLLLNSDATLVAGSMGAMRRALLEHDSVGIVAPAVYSADACDLQTAAYGVFPTLKAVALRTNHNPRETLWPDWVSGVAMLIRRSDFVAIGGFDPDFRMYLEDVDLCRRIRDAGKCVRRELSASVIHLGGRSWHASREQSNEAQRSRVLYYRKAGYSAADRFLVEAIRVAHLVGQRVRRRRGVGFP
jgi:GT2 family glycosyltransferase